MIRFNHRQDPVKNIMISDEQNLNFDTCVILFSEDCRRLNMNKEMQP